MEGAKSEDWIDVRKNIFGSDVEDIRIIDKYIIFYGPTFRFVRTQKLICLQFGIPSKVIYGVEFLKKKKQTNNWFEKLFGKKEDWLRIYY